MLWYDMLTTADLYATFPASAARTESQCACTSIGGTLVMDSGRSCIGEMLFCPSTCSSCSSWLTVCLFIDWQLLYLFNHSPFSFPLMRRDYCDCGSSTWTGELYWPRAMDAKQYLVSESMTSTRPHIVGEGTQTKNMGSHMPACACLWASPRENSNPGGLASPASLATLRTA